MISRTPALSLSLSARQSVLFTGTAMALTPLLTLYVLHSTVNACLAILFACLGAALLLPTPAGLVVWFAYVGVSGWLKDVTNYYPLIHLGPDLLILAVAARWAAVRLSVKRNMHVKLPLAKPLAAFVLWSFLLAFTPLTNPLLAVGGLKAYVEPILFYLLAYDTLTSPRQLRPFLAALIPIAIAMPAYAFVQVVQGPQAVASLGPGFAREMQLFQPYFAVSAGASFSAFKPLSFGGDPGNAASIDFAALFVMLAVALAPGRRGGQMEGLARVGALLSIPLCVGGVLLSGARLFEAAIALGLLSLLLLRPGRSTVMLAVIALPLILGGGALAGHFTNGAATARVGTLTNPVPAYLADRGFVLAQIPSTMFHHPLGIGMGKAVAGSGTVSRLLGIPVQAQATENFFLVMLDELGIPGAALIIFLNCALIVLCWRAVSMCSQPRLRWFAVCVVAFGVAETVTWFAGPTLQGTIAAFFWFLSGATLKLCRQERPVPRVATQRRSAASILPYAPAPAG